MPINCGSKRSLKLSGWNLLIALTVIGGALWIWFSRVQADSPEPALVAAAHEGFIAPDFELKDEQGNFLMLSSLRGNPVVINFWASWCSPCKAEMPALELVHQKYKDQGLIILAVNSANQDDPQQAIAFSKDLGLSFQILFDDDGKASELYNVLALPTSYFIDSNGIIKDIIIGGPVSEALLDIRIQQILEGVE